MQLAFSEEGVLHAGKREIVAGVILASSAVLAAVTHLKPPKPLAKTPNNPARSIRKLRGLEGPAGRSRGPGGTH